MGVHLLLAERSHVLDLLVVALHPLLVLWDLLGVQQFIGGRVLEINTRNTLHVSLEYSHDQIIIICTCMNNISSVYSVCVANKG